MNRQTGFSLLEILVAFSILAISLGILLKIFSSGINTAVIAEEYTVATQIAESLMAKTGIEEPLVEGETSGTRDYKFHWQVKVETLPNSSADNKILELMAVQVIVHWDSGNQNQRIVELNTLKIGQGS